MSKLGVAMVGCGGIALANHVPGVSMCANADLVALCDTNEDVLNRGKQSTGVEVGSTNYEEIVTRDDVQAVIIATPNVAHAPIAFKAFEAGKHVLCEKPLAMGLDEGKKMLAAAQAAGVRHMTAFTYRFVPAMHYMSHLVKQGAIGQPYHFRAQRFQDWGQRDLGWRQEKKLAGTGELGDMLSHRIDFAHFLIGPIKRVVGQTRRVHDDRNGHASDLEDWVAAIGEFANCDATSVFESTKIASGWGEGPHSRDYCEVNGAEGTLVYQVSKPNEILRGKLGETGLETVPVPQEFLTWPGSPRDPSQGDPLQVFRYDQDFEFIDAIEKQRDCNPSFVEGVQTQAVMEAIVDSSEKGEWVDVPQFEA